MQVVTGLLLQTMALFLLVLVQLSVTTVALTPEALDPSTVTQAGKLYPTIFKPHPAHSPHHTQLFLFSSSTFAVPISPISFLISFFYFIYFEVVTFVRGKAPQRQTFFSEVASPPAALRRLTRIFN
jgi:hypothetical protein